MSLRRHLEETPLLGITNLTLFNLHTVKFTVYRSKGFDKCVELCKHCHNQDTEQFYRGPSSPKLPHFL